MRLRFGQSACAFHDLKPFFPPTFHNSPVCKAELENVFVFESPQDTRPYAALQIWGTEAGPGVVYDDRAQARFVLCVFWGGGDSIWPLLVLKK